MRFLPLIGCLCLPFATAMAQDQSSLDEQVHQLQSLATKSTSSSPTAQAETSMGQLQVAGTIASLSSYVDQGNYDEGLRFARNLLKKNLTPELKSAVEALISSLEKERAARNGELTSQTNALIKKISDSCWRAKSGADLDPLMDDIANLRDSLQSGGNSPVINRLQNRISMMEQFLNRWFDYLSARDDGDMRRELEVLQELPRESTYRPFIAQFPPQGLKALLAKLREDLTAEIRASFDNDLKDLAAAQTLEDYQKIAVNLDELQRTSSNNDSGSDLPNRINQLHNAITYWINALRDQQAGDFVQAMRELNNVGNNYESAFPSTLVNKKRQELLNAILTNPPPQRLPPPILVDQLDKVASASDVDALSQRLMLVENAGFNDEDGQLNLLRNALSGLSQQWRQLEKKHYDAFWGFSNSDQPGAWSPKIDALREKLLGRALVEQYGATDPAQSKLSIDGTFDAVYQQAADKGQWSQALAILTTKGHYLASIGCGCIPIQNQIDTLRAFVEAQNLEQAEQWADAVKSYRLVVRSSDPLIPRRQAIDQLKKILKDHSEADAKP